MLTKALLLGEHLKIAEFGAGADSGYWAFAGPGRPQGESLWPVYTAIIWKQWN